MAEIVGQYFVDKKLGDCVEYNEKTKNFKLKIIPSTTPDPILRAIKGCTKETCTFFAGVRVKVKILPSYLLSAKLLSDLKALGQTYNLTDWVTTMLERRELRRKQAGQQFYQLLSLNEM